MMGPFDMSIVDRWSEVRTGEITQASVAAYAAAIDDPSGALSPVYAVVPAMRLVIEVAGAVCAPELRARVVHGQQDLLLHRRLPVGDPVAVRAAVVGLHGKASGTIATIKVETRDGAGRMLNEQYVTEFYRGVATDLAVGLAAPAPDRVDRRAAGDPLVSVTARLAPDLPRRYADASGDHNPIHLDEAFARAAGLPGVIVHGLANLAFAARAVLTAARASAPDFSPDLAPDPHSDGGRFHRLSCRFTRPVGVDDVLTTRVWASGGGRYRFESVDGAGQRVLGDGLAALA